MCVHACARVCVYVTIRQPAADALSNSYTLSLLLLDDVLMGIFCMIPVVLAAERYGGWFRNTSILFIGEEAVCPFFNVGNTN